MMPANNPERKIKGIVEQLDNAVARRIEYLELHKKRLNQDIALIESYDYLHEDALIFEALSEVRDNLDAATAEYYRIKARAGFLGLKSPLKLYKASRRYAEAEKYYQQKNDALHEAQPIAERQLKINEHTHWVDKEKSRLPVLKREQDECLTELALARTFQRNATDACRAAEGTGWLAHDFMGYFLAIVEAVNEDDYRKACQLLPMLRFQKKPTPEQYLVWAKEANLLREQAFKQQSGMPATSAYREIAAHSIQLAKNTLRQSPPGYLNVAEQWQFLSYLTIVPQKFHVDAHWAIYWAMFQCGQSLANVITHTDQNEDTYTGELRALVNHWLARWANERIAKFGYPQSRSFFGTLMTAGTKEETRTGADIGLIVDLNIGGMVCRKAALFQAKKTRAGRADIGSHSDQLAKLTLAPAMGYYLFYHQYDYPLSAPAPTVCSAAELRMAIEASGRDIHASRLGMDVKSVGWDWASFVSFGLCEADSGIGVPFTTAQEALTLLGGGSAGLLPKNLLLISVSGDEMVEELIQALRNDYHLAKDQLKQKGHARSGPQLSL
ncbi:hypothetical protein [Kosakonia sp.]|uniref:hypothetical protein n=1 Tax=Kosakonia sp. TaxID=1916651 RepID=UPI00289639A0|nr:hypothetical protein [Kosakonia sp.]